MTTSTIPESTKESYRAYERSIKHDARLEIITKQFEVLFNMVEIYQLRSSFDKLLEEYEYYDLDRAKDILASEVP